MRIHGAFDCIFYLYFRNLPKSAQIYEFRSYIYIFGTDSRFFAKMSPHTLRDDPTQLGR